MDQSCQRHRHHRPTQRLAKLKGSMLFAYIHRQVFRSIRPFFSPTERQLDSTAQLCGKSWP
jgi:hypothetical protein